MILLLGHLDILKDTTHQEADDESDVLKAA